MYETSYICLITSVIILDCSHNCKNRLSLKSLKYINEIITKTTFAGVAFSKDCIYHHYYDQST